MKSAVWTLFFIFFLFGQKAMAQMPTSPPPDSLIALLFSVRMQNAPDSIKGKQIADVFRKFGIDTTRYRQFYERFLARPVPKQQQWIQKVARLIRKMVAEERKRQQQKAPPPFPTGAAKPLNPDGSE